MATQVIIDERRNYTQKSTQTAGTYVCLTSNPTRPTKEEIEHNSCHFQSAIAVSYKIFNHRAIKSTGLVP